MTCERNEVHDDERIVDFEVEIDDPVGSLVIAPSRTYGVRAALQSPGKLWLVPLKRRKYLQMTFYSTKKKEKV